MNSITITHELCAEDRARLDRLTAALERRTCDQCVASALEVVGQKHTEPDPIQAKLAETIAKATAPAETPKNTTEEAETSTPSVTQPEEEKPTAAETTPTETTAEPTVTLEQIQQKVVQLAAGFGGTKKTKVREIVNTYAKKVSDLPEDKWTEVWEKLTALESEG